MKFNAFDQFSPAIDDMKSLLFPFSFKKWLKLGFVAMLSGGGSGSGFNGSSSSNWNLPSEERTNEITANAVAGLEGTPWYYFVFPIVLLVVVLGLVMTFITSVFNFIFLEALDKKDVSIKQGWRDNKSLGGSFFLYRIVLGLMILGVLVLASLPVAIPMMQQGIDVYFKNFSLGSLAIILPLILFLVAFFIVVGVFKSLVYNFSSVHMYYKKVPAWQSIRETFSEISNNKLAVFVFLLARIIIGIGISIIVTVGVLLLLIPLAIIAVPIALIYIGLASSLGWSVPMIVAGSVLGILFAVFFIYLVSVMALPLTAFSRYFSIRNYHALMKHQGASEKEANSILT